MANRRNELNEGYIEGLRAARRIVERMLREGNAKRRNAGNVPYGVDEMPKDSISYNFDVGISSHALFDVVLSFDSDYLFDVYELLYKVANALRSEPSLYDALLSSDNEKARFTGVETFIFLFKKQPGMDATKQSVASAFKRALHSIPQMKYDRSVLKRPH